MANAEEKTEYDFDGMAEIVGDINSYEPPTEEEMQPELKPLLPGYISEDDWVASGRDAKDWQSPEVFAANSQRIKETSRLKRELAEKDKAIKQFDERLKDNNLLWQGQLSRQRAELMEKRDDAIDVADKAEVKKLDKQIADLDAEADLVEDKPKAAVVQPPEVVEWEEENPWIHDVKDPRTAAAQAAFTKAHGEGKTLAYALRQADKAAAAIRHESTQQEIKKKPAISMSDSSRAASSGGDSLTLSWNQLTREEKDLHEELFSNKTQKEYLKIVADARTGVKK